MCLADALLYTADGTNLATEAHLAGHGNTSVDGGVHIAGKYGGNDAEVQGGVRNAQTSGYVQEDVLLCQLEAYALLQYGKEHVQSFAIKTYGASLCRTVGGGRHQSLSLYEEGAHALYGRGYGHTREALAIVGKEQFGGIGNLAQAVVPHLVDTQFGGTSETVLYASEDTVHIVLVALELKHGVHDVLQNLGTCQGALLGDVADEQDAHSARLGIAQERGGTLAYLRERTGTGFHGLGGDGLYGVDDNEIGLCLLYL